VVYVDRLGVEFKYQGDYLIWLWPWRRKQALRLKYLSICSEGYFPSLSAVRQFWIDFQAACARANDLYPTNEEECGPF
jgi:hypothetical protein